MANLAEVGHQEVILDGTIKHQSLSFPIFWHHSDPDGLGVRGVSNAKRFSVKIDLATMRAIDADKSSDHFRPPGADQTGNTKNFAFMKLKRNGGEIRFALKAFDLDHHPPGRIGGFGG